MKKLLIVLVMFYFLIRAGGTTYQVEWYYQNDGWITAKGINQGLSTPWGFTYFYFPVSTVTSIIERS